MGKELTGVALVRVFAQGPLGELEFVLGDDLVEGECSSAHDLTGVAVAQDVPLSICGELSRPFG